AALDGRRRREGALRGRGVFDVDAQDPAVPLPDVAAGAEWDVEPALDKVERAALGQLSSVEITALVAALERDRPSLLRLPGQTIQRPDPVLLLDARLRGLTDVDGLSVQIDERRRGDAVLGADVIAAVVLLFIQRRRKRLRPPQPLSADRIHRVDAVVL